MSASRFHYVQAAWPPDTGPHQSTTPHEVRWIPILWPLCHSCARPRKYTKHAQSRTQQTLVRLSGPMQPHPTTPNTRLISRARPSPPRPAAPSSLSAIVVLAISHFYSTAHVFSPTRHASSPAVHLNLGKTPQRESFNFNRSASHTRSKHPTRRHSAHRPRPSPSRPSFLL